MRSLRFCRRRIGPKSEIGTDRWPARHCVCSVIVLHMLGSIPSIASVNRPARRVRLSALCGKGLLYSTAVATAEWLWGAWEMYVPGTSPLLLFCASLVVLAALIAVRKSAAGLSMVRNMLRGVVWTALGFVLFFVLIGLSHTSHTALSLQFWLTPLIIMINGLPFVFLTGIAAGALSKELGPVRMV
jgi:hypothetical protein